MLTLLEKILFILFSLAAVYAAWQVGDRIVRIIARGHGKPDWQVARRRLVIVLGKIISLQPTFRVRIIPSIFHALVAWGFFYFLIINLGDLLEAFLPSFTFLGNNRLADLYRLGADLISVGVLAGMSALVLRRWLIRPDNLTSRADILLHPKARAGIRKDSAIIAAFILIHVGARFLGRSVLIALDGSDVWQPFANKVAQIWGSVDIKYLIIASHILFWLAMSAILLLIPYLLYSKHIHLIFAPINYLLKPVRRSIGELSRLNFEDESVEQFGASRLEDLGWEQIMDAYACIMCYRCQEVCPAYATGKVLSPAALEINKRYLLNEEGKRIARGEASSQMLTQFAIPPDAVWACTACGACVDICPTNNEPMRDILDIRRSMVLMENDFPVKLQTAFRGMERTANPWNVPTGERLKWAEGLVVPTIDENPEPEILWWVGCAPAIDARAQKTARAFAQIMISAGVNFAVLGEQEQCTGDSARRAGNEYLFNELATTNVEILNEVAPKRIVTTCPHCLHTLRNEYPDFGGNYQVIHHTHLIDELITSGRLNLAKNKDHPIAYHDPCYLGRHNQILSEPRRVLAMNNSQPIELPRHGRKSFCCGAGGAQMWKEEENGTERISANRIQEAIKSGVEILAVGCPFCMVMLTDAVRSANAQLEVRDVAEIIAGQIDTHHENI